MSFLAGLSWSKIRRFSICLAGALVLPAVSVVVLGSGKPLQVTARGAALPISYSVQQASSRWITETVDTSGGWSPALVLDQYQKPHIAYECARGVCYATLSGSSWVTQTIGNADGEVSMALDSAGHFHVSAGNGNLNYLYFNGTTWIKTQIDPAAGFGTGLGRNSTLALDSQGHPHITYYSIDTFRHARYTGSQWVTETVAANTAGYGAGISAGLLIDQADHLHALYTVGAYDNAQVMYAYFNGAGWMTQTIATGFGGSLALAPDGSIHSSFIAPPADSGDWYHLKYASLHGSTWTVQEVTQIATQTLPISYAPLGVANPGATALKFDSVNNPHIAFFNPVDAYGAGYLRYAQFDGASWRVETIDTDGTPGWTRLSLALDPSDYPAIAYLSDWGNQTLRYAYTQRPSHTLTSAGGTFVYTDEQSMPTTIQVPMNAITESLDLVFTPHDHVTGAPAGFIFAGQGFQLEAYQTNGTHLPGYHFSQPVTLTIAYTDSDIAGSEENTLELRYWDGNAWSTDGLTVINRDVADNRLVVTTAHLSRFAMFGQTHQIYLPLALKH